jgi:hypothetical protein
VPVDVRAVHSSTLQWVSYVTDEVSTPIGDEFILGETKPDASNTGYAVGTNFTVTNGNVTFSTNNQLIENRHFTGIVTVTGKNITFRNCWFNGPTGYSGLVMLNNANTENIVMERCTMRPSTFSTKINCVSGHSFTLRRCNISGGVDGVDIYRSSTGGVLNAKLYGNYIHDLAYFTPDSAHSDNQTHSDIIQIHYGGSNIDIYGNNLEGSIDPTIGSANQAPTFDQNGVVQSGNKNYPEMVCLSVLMASPISTTAGLTNVNFEKNWTGKGVVVINWPRSDATNVVIKDNRWTRGMLLGDDYTILAKAAQPMTITGNYYEDTGTAYNGRKNG